MTSGHVLTAEDLLVPAEGADGALLLNLKLAPGELVLILSANRRRNGVVVDHLLGLQDPPTAGVCFLGQAWSELGREQAFLLRREVGRVQYRGNWMESHSVMDNILLPMMHNSIATESSLRQDASALAQQFGLPGLPTLPPSQVPEADLCRAACVRAFLGQPLLVVLEHPLNPATSGLLGPMMNAIQQVRRRQGAVLWFSEFLDQVADPGIPVSQRLRVIGGSLVPLQG